jgi:hypothetical protein
MSPGVQPDPAVPVEVLPPVPKDADLPSPPRERVPFEGLKSFYHPASGVIILGLDWLLFGSDLMTDFLALPAMCVLGFLATFPLVLIIQRAWSRNNWPSAIGKAFLGAFMVGLPFPVTGTLLGAGILLLSGLPHHPVDAVKKAMTAATPR